MAGEVTKQDQALTRGAQMVSSARGDLEQQLSSLRGKLGDSGWITTVRGVGFKIGNG